MLFPPFPCLRAAPAGLGPLTGQAQPSGGLTNRDEASCDNSGFDCLVFPLTDHLLSTVKSVSSCIEQLEKCWSQYLACPEGKKGKGWSLLLVMARQGSEMLECRNNDGFLGTEKGVYTTRKAGRDEV